MIQLSKKLQNLREKLSKYLANIGFASRRSVENLFKEKVILLNGKKAKHIDLLKDNDVLTITLNNPQYKNALSEELTPYLRTILKRLKKPLDPFLSI